MGEVRSTIAKKLKELRKRSKLNVDQVGEYLGKSGKTISAWEVGRGEPDGDELIALCKLFHANITEFYGEAINIDTTSPFVDIPVYGSIAAGSPIEMIQIEETFPLAKEMHDDFPNAFFLRVKGESMNRILPNGVLALVDPCTTIDFDNDPYAVCVNGFDATIKRVHKLNNGFELVPDSSDPTFKPVIYDYGIEGTETITPIGRVVYHAIPFNWKY